MRYKAAIFDLDGTLADTLADLTDAINYGLQQFGRPQRTAQALSKMIGDGIRVTIGRAIGAGKQELIAGVVEKMCEKYAQICLDKTRPYDGMFETVAELHKSGVKLAVLTNKDQASAEKIVGHFFDGYFEIVRGTTLGGPVKPDPSPAFRIIAQLGVKPQETVFIGDSGIDMQTAKACQNYAVGVSWGLREVEELRQNGADVIIDYPKQLLGIFTDSL
ncbi:MAG: HAD family hydrolase [Phycisphaerae bacterium]|nr:HAD family hydrolase [Phycisphaerae bacterium]